MTRITLMQYLAEALPDASFGVAGPNQAYPAGVYGFVDPSGTGKHASFDADTETFTVQLSAFDNKAGGEDLADLMQDLMDGIEAMDYADIISITKTRGTGPTFLDNEREWRMTQDYEIVMAASAQS